MSQRLPITAAGLEKLKDTLKNLRAVERPAIVRAIEEARAHGDLSENAEYHAAKEKQGMIEAKVKDLEDRIARAEVIDIAKVRSDRIAFGATVRLLDTGTEEETTYKLLGEDETDPKAGIISINSPVARSMIGKRTGDTVEIRLPKKQAVYEVLSVEYIP